MPRGLHTSARPAAAPSAVRAGRDVLTVSELTRGIKQLLEGRIGSVSVSGETAGLKASPSGHIYFSLKDAAALVDCVIWRSAASRIRSLPKDGAVVTVTGKLAVYEPRGRYQLVVASLAENAGKGDLWQKFEELKTRLAAEGFFDPARKRLLPARPNTLGIVTSPSGAALRDILKILARRAPYVRTVLSPTAVQGTGAAEEIAAALNRLDRWGGADVVIVGRGGGSLEDLWAFNEEAVARAIAAARCPVVSAVGHETDFSIADFVADARAATPSEAAEMIAPDAGGLLREAAAVAGALRRALGNKLEDCRDDMMRVAGRQAYARPDELFSRRWQQLDDAGDRLGRAAREGLRRAGTRRDVAEARLRGLSPLAVLERGYAVVLGPDGKALVDAASVPEGTEVTALLHKGRLTARVIDRQW